MEDGGYEEFSVRCVCGIYVCCVPYFDDDGYRMGTIISPFFVGRISCSFFIVLQCVSFIVVLGTTVVWRMQAFCAKGTWCTVS